MSTIDNDTGGELPGGEESADLMNLEAMAAGDPQAVVQPVEGEAEAVQVRAPLAEELAGMLMMLSGMASPLFPSLAKIYTPETCAAVGGAIAPVCDKYGWLQNGMGGEWGPEIMCVAVVGPIGYATVLAVKNDIAARDAKDDAKVKQAGQNKLQVVELGKPAPVVEAGPESWGSGKVTVGGVPV